MNNFYPFGGRWTSSGTQASTNRFLYNGKELQTTGDVNYLDYGARMYDSRIGRWHSIDPLAEKYYPLSTFHYALNSPILFIDPFGASSTHYVDEDYNIILQTNDGSDAVVVVPEEHKEVMEYYADNYDSWAYHLDNPEWNLSLFDEGFVLAARQFSPRELRALNRQSSIWSRNASAAYHLKPTFKNTVLAAVKEALSQWVDPERLVMAASIGVAGLGGMKPTMRNVGVPKPSPKFHTPTNSPQLPISAPKGMQIRVMKPTAQYPNGYWRLEKPMPQGKPQGINLPTMKPGAQWETHISLPSGYWK